MLQAIDLANGAILSKYLNAGANNLKAKATESQQFVNWLFEHTLGRLPTMGEQEIISSVMTDPKDSQQVEDLLWLVFYAAWTFKLSGKAFLIMNIPESIQRRDFIKQLGLASTAALATNGTQAWGNEKIFHPAAKADSCILIWMAGGHGGT